MAKFTFSDFAASTGLTLTGDAVANINNGIDAGKVLRLVPASTIKAGRVMYTQAVDVAQFETEFSFRFSGQGGPNDLNGTPGADGICFVIHNMETLPTLLAGGYMAYGGITPSIGIEFDTYFNAIAPYDFDNSHGYSSHVGLNKNGSLISVAVAQIAPDMDNASTLHAASVSYKNGNFIVTLNGSQVISNALDLAAQLGATKAWVGFTAATGDTFANNDLISWTFESLSPSNAIMFSCNS